MLLRLFFQAIIHGFSFPQLLVLNISIYIDNFSSSLIYVGLFIMMAYSLGIFAVYNLFNQCWQIFGFEQNEEMHSPIDKTIDSFFRLMNKRFL